MARQFHPLSSRPDVSGRFIVPEFAPLLNSGCPVTADPSQTLQKLARSGDIRAFAELGLENVGVFACPI